MSPDNQQGRETVPLHELQAQELTAKAQSGDAEAQLKLGQAYAAGSLGLKQDMRNAVLWYKRAAQQNHAESLVRFGECYEKGSGVQQDPKKAFETYTKAVEAGASEGLLKVGLCYAYGIGVEVDADKAEEFLTKASAHGEANAFTELGLMFEDGEDFEKAIYWYEQAVENGDLEGQYRLAWMYEKGTGVETDLQKAQELYELAAARGHAPSQNNLGIVLENIEESKDPADRDYSQMMQWYQKSASGGNPFADANLGRVYEFGIGVEVDPLEAEYWYRRASEGGNLWATFRLGRMLLLGQGIEQDATEGLRLLTEASVEQHEAAFEIADAYYYGEAVERNPKEAYSWYKKAIDDGNECYRSLAFAAVDLEDRKIIEETLQLALEKYDEGVDSLEHPIANLCAEKEDYDNALSWAFQAEEKGDTFVRGLIARIYNKVADKDKCLEWALKACEDGAGYALRAAASYYEEYGDIANALYWYDRAAKAGYPGAQEDYDELKAQGKCRFSTGDLLEQHKAGERQHQRQQPQALPPQYGVYQDFPPGTILDNKYLVETILGRGGMAAVFEGRHLLMDTRVAIKVMLPERSDDETLIRRFQREAKTAISLQHPNIIRVYDFGFAEGHKPYLVMEFLEGQALESLIEEEGPLPPDRAIPILVQICDAMHAAHEAGIVHRDLKPANVMLIKSKATDDFVKLVDFGIAKADDEQHQQSQKLTKTGEVYGSLIYMSPEQCLNKPLDRRSDIYALGCTMFEVLTGELPFCGDTVFETLNKHINEPPPSLANLIPYLDCADQLEIIVNKTLAKDPADRFQTMMEVKEALNGLTVLS